MAAPRFRVKPTAIALGLVLISLVLGLNALAYGLRQWAMRRVRLKLSEGIRVFRETAVLPPEASENPCRDSGFGSTWPEPGQRRRTSAPCAAR